MMGQCSQCGSGIPGGQSICSMCMGDMSHGRDGYYQEWAREQERQHKAALDAEYEAYLAEQEAQWHAEQQAMHDAEQEAAGQAAQAEAEYNSQQGEQQ